MPEVDSRLLDQRADAQRAGVALQMVEMWTVVRRRQIEKRIFACFLEGKTLDPQAAVQAWAEVHAAESFAVAMRNKLKTGKAAGEKIAEAMSGEED